MNPRKYRIFDPVVPLTADQIYAVEWMDENGLGPIARRAALARPGVRRAWRRLVVDPYCKVGDWEAYAVLRVHAHAHRLPVSSSLRESWLSLVAYARHYRVQRGLVVWWRIDASP